MSSTLASSELLLSTGSLLAVRLNGRPRDPDNGQHKQVVIYAETTVTPLQLAGLLHDAADRLELLAPPTGSLAPASASQR